MLQTRLEAAARNLEPSKRIWWREEFGGCAPDREPLESEICNKEAEDLGKVLKTSPPILKDDFYNYGKKSKTLAPSSRMRDRSSTLLDTPIIKPDEVAKTTIQNFTYEREIQWLSQKPFRHSSSRASTDSRSLKNPGHYIPNESPPFKYPPQRQLRGTQRKSPTDHNPKRMQPEWSYSPPLIAAARFHPENQCESPFREPFVRPKAGSSKSPTHYVPNKLPPLKIPDLSKEHPARSALRKRKKITAEQDEKLLQADLQWLIERNFEIPQAVRSKAQFPKSPIHFNPDGGPPLSFPDPDLATMNASRRKPRVYTAEEEEQSLQSAPRRPKDQLEQLRLYGIPLDQSEPLPAENSISVPQSDRFEQVPNNSPIQDKESKPEEHRQMKRVLYQKIAGMKLRRSHRQGITIHHSENASSASSYSVPHVDPVEEELSIAEMFPASQELRQLKLSLLEKIEAMRLRRSRRHGAAIYRSEASVPVGSDSPSRHDEVREVSSKIEPQPRSSEASPQQLEPSLWKKVEAMKQRLSRQQGTAIYQAKEPKYQDLAPPSDKDDQATGVLPGTQVHKQSLMLDRPQSFRVRSCQNLKAVELGRGGRQGTARSV